MRRGAGAQYRDPQETTASWWSFPPLQHIPDRLGFLLVGKGRRTLDIVPLTPPLPFICVLRNGAPPAFHGLGAPDQGASQGPFGPLGPNGGDQH